MCIRQGVLYEKGHHMNTVTVNQLASSSLLLFEEVVSMHVSFPKVSWKPSRVNPAAQMGR